MTRSTQAVQSARRAIDLRHVQLRIRRRNTRETRRSDNGHRRGEIRRSCVKPGMHTIARRIIHEDQFECSVARSQCQRRPRFRRQVTRHLHRCRPRSARSGKPRPAHHLVGIAIRQHYVAIGEPQNRLIERLSIGDHRRRRPHAIFARYPIQLIRSGRIVGKNNHHIPRRRTGAECRNGRNPRRRRGGVLLWLPAIKAILEVENVEGCA